MIEFDATIEHGPSPRARWRAPSRPSWLRPGGDGQDGPGQAGVRADQGRGPLTADAIVAYGGHGASTAQIAPVKFSRDGIDLDFSGMKIDGTYDHAKQAVVARGVIDTIGVDGLKAQRERDKFKWPCPACPST